MVHPIARLAYVAALMTGASLTSAMAQGSGPAGRLTCNVGSGIGLVVTSQRPMDCRFTPRRGPVQRYVGVVRNFGLDLGTIRASTMSWRVYGPYPRPPQGALSGTYAGASAGAAIGVGGSGSVLVGGLAKDVTLQPLSLQGRRGVNVALGVTGFELTQARMPGRR